MNRSPASWIVPAFLLAAACAIPAPAFAAAAPAAASAAKPESSSRIVSVTLYQSSALVGREVAVPEGAGKIEIVVPGLPASVQPGSLYGEGSADIRILSTRFRSRPLPQTSQEELRKLEAQLKDLQKTEALLTQQVEAATANTAFLGKLENFTGATMQSVTEKGQLSAEAVTKLSQFIMDTRNTAAASTVNLRQQIQAGREQQEYLGREIARLSATSDKTSREAVVVVDKASPAAGKVSLFYLVSAASWHPQYKIRSLSDKKEVQVEYLAAMHQGTGEDWSEVDLTLSTAMPMFDAAPPELVAMEVQPTAVGAAKGSSGRLGLNIDNNAIQLKTQNEGLESELRFRQSAQTYVNAGNKLEADKAFNTAAAIQQAAEIAQTDDQTDLRATAKVREGQSVTFHLERKLSIPWRDDEQVIEVTRTPLQAEFFYKAVPVLTEHVYRLASLTNNGKYVILPGEATMYVGNDFVGRATLPLVATGQTFTAGFGVDPQIQVKRELVEKTRSVQGGNQVQKFDYRITLSSYKPEPARVELWDRTPYAEGEAISIAMQNSAPALSKDEAYARDQQPKGLLRWDLTLEPNTSGAKATRVTYQYKMEYAKDSAIGNIFNRK